MPLVKVEAMIRADEDSLIAIALGNEIKPRKQFKDSYFS